MGLPYLICIIVGKSIRRMFQKTYANYKKNYKDKK